MANLDDVFDDALRAFDDDDTDVASSAQHGTEGCHASSSHIGNGKEAPPQAEGATADTPAATHSPPTAAAHKAASAAPQLPPRRKAAKPFDPLGSKGKAGSSSKSSGKAAAAVAVAGKSEAAELSQQLERLLAEWSEAGPGPGSAAAASAGGSFPGIPFTAPGASTAGATTTSSSSSNVLRALAEHTQRTVEDQARLSGAAAAAASGAGGEAGGSGSHVDQVVDMVMQHLLSKEVLYQPMKEIRDKYPPWLAAHEGGAGGVTPSDLARYKQQYASICALVDMYESQPDNFQGILQHLQEMQACGEPPADIVEDMSAAIAADLPNLAGGGAASTSTPSATAAAAAAAAAGLGAGMPGAGDDSRMDALLGELLGNAFPGGLGRPAGLSGGGLDGLPKELAGNCPIQ